MTELKVTKKTAERNPELVIHDFGICSPRHECDHREPPPGEIEICRAWIREWVTPRKSINYRRSSYGLKHDVERASRADGVSYAMIDRQGRPWTADRVYASNGSFIAAALLEGYRMVRTAGLGSPNAHFNMSIHKPVTTLLRVALSTLAATAAVQGDR